MRNNIKFITNTALIAGLYTALTIGFSFLSYGQVQFRMSEILVLFAFIDPKYALGLTIGCVLANLFSPLGIVDVVFGTLATVIAIYSIILVRKYIKDIKKSLLLASLGPVLSNGIIVGLELKYLFETPFLINFFYVALGEFVVVSLLGVGIIKLVMKSKRLVEILSF